MEHDVRQYVASCLVCQQIKGKTHPLYLLGRYPVHNRKFQSVAVGLLGPLPLTEAGNKYTLTCVDYLTLYTVVAALKNKEAAEVA